MKHTMVAVWVGVVLSTFTAAANRLFTEGFGSLPDATAITTTNTAFSYARVGTGVGSYLAAKNPGSFTGSSAVLLCTGSSLTGMGVTNGTYGAFDVGTLAFSFRTPQSFSVANDLYTFVGSGNTFSGNTAFSGNDLTAGFAILGGQLQTRNSLNAWANVGPPLAPNTKYNLRIVFNGSDAQVAYGSEAVGAGTADVWLDGALVGNDISIRDMVSVSAFRIYMTGSLSATPYEVDNISLDDSAVPVPEPRSAAPIALASLLASIARRRKR